MLLSETETEVETEAPAETYSATTVALSDYFTMYRGLLGNMGMWSSGEEWLPYSPLEVAERVYVKLGDRTYTGGEHEQAVESFIGELRALAAKAPKRATAIIKLGTGYGCDDESCRDPEWEVGYWRDPTKKERAKREETNRKIDARDERRATEKRASERTEYERLKAIFEE